jgi:hypothetical protein
MLNITMRFDYFLEMTKWKQSEPEILPLESIEAQVQKLGTEGNLHVWHIKVRH